MKKIHATVAKLPRELRISDQFELYLTSPKGTKRLIINIENLITHEKVCHRCAKPFGTNKRYEFNRREYCYDCYKIKREEHRKAKSGHEPAQFAFRNMY